MTIKIPILWGINYEMEKFDFSFMDISLIETKSEAFKEYFRKHDGENFNENNFPEVIEEIHQDLHDESLQYAIVKNDPNTGYDYSDIYNVFRILHVIYPSDLQILHIMDYNPSYGVHGGGYSRWDIFRASYPGDMLIAYDEEIPKVNDFIKKHFHTFKKSNYIGFIINNYETSFQASHFHFMYLSLCMSLEGLIDGNTEITYRLKRTVAVLAGKTMITSKRLYETLGKIYGLRSKIIHSEPYDYSAIHNYLKTLRAIISRVIIELVIHDIEDIKTLGDKITTLGFGDHEKISDNWEDFNFNAINRMNMWKELESFKPKKS